jgi:hypothetical protein
MDFSIPNRGYRYYRHKEGIPEIPALYDHITDNAESINKNYQQ